MSVTTVSIGREAQPPEASLDSGASLIEWLRCMRAERPVWRDSDGSVHVFRHEDVARIMSDNTTFSTESAIGSDWAGHGPADDVPDGLAADGMALQIRRIGNDLLDDLAFRERVDILREFAHPFTILASAAQLGVQASDEPQFHAWWQAILADDPETTEGGVTSGRTREQLRDWVVEHLRRVRDPRPHGFLLRLAADADGEGRHDQAGVDLLTSRLAAGIVSARAFLVNVIMELASRPVIVTRLRADPALIPAFLEEMMRIRPPFLRFERRPTEAVNVAGTEVEAGTPIYLWWLSANRDERAFLNPDAVSLHRPKAQRMTLGCGLPPCWSAPLTRLPVEVAVGLVLDRYEGFRLDAERTVRFHPNRSNIFGPMQLPVQLTPRRESFPTANYPRPRPSKQPWTAVE